MASPAVQLDTEGKAENQGLKDEDAAKYIEAYAASRNDISLSENDRLSIEQKYVSALLLHPDIHHNDLVEFAKTVLIDHTSSIERRNVAISVAGKLLRQDLKLPTKGQDAFIISVLHDLSSPMPAWNPGSQGAFIMSMAALGKEIAIGTEDNGVWIYNQTTGVSRQFTIKDGLGDDDAYALKYDRSGRLWVGHLNHGVSVYNGKAWMNYSTADGPIGSRIFALETSPVDGDVWMATDAGLTRYSLKNDRWKAYTVADGLPSNQATCLAFDKRGTLYLGTACDGIAIATLRDDYSKWRRVTGPASIPNAPSGDGLPSNLINALLVTDKGTVWAGTTCGLAHSEDSGINWQFTRGKDWEDKIRGLRQGPKLNPNTGENLLLEDYVTCLTQGANGKLYIGYRQQNYEVREATTGIRLFPLSGDVVPTLYLSTLLPLENGYVLLARYGDGIRQDVPFAGEGHSEIGHPANTVIDNSPLMSPLPSKALLPSIASLGSMLRQVQGFRDTIAPGEGYYIGQDWVTEGDWIGRYGRQYAVLCAAGAPLDHEIQAVAPFVATPEIGPHHGKDDGLRHWVHWAKTDNPRCLYDPIPGYRRQAEWDDHGEGYSNAEEGPDIWISVDVPEGVHRVSLYFMNKDGHDGANRYRDYLVELRQYAPSTELAEQMPVIAHTRVRDFWGGVYQNFAVAGPGKFWLKVAKNNSLNTIVSSVFIDQLTGPKQPNDGGRLAWMGAVRYDMPELSSSHKLSSAPLTILPPQSSATSETDEKQLSAARHLWAALDASQAHFKSSVTVQWPYRLFAYRTALACGAPEAMLAAWRWKLDLWTPADRKRFEDTMDSAHKSLLDLNPQMKGLEF